MNAFAPLAALLVTGLAAAGPSAVRAAPDSPRPTIVANQAALARLRNNSGLTLQWIDWDRRGRVRVSQIGGVVHLTGMQGQAGGRGRLDLEGDVVRIDATSFTFRGHIGITDTPDPGRACMRDGEYEFRITQNRRYWRLQQMEQCDGLTDYVDIYF